MTTDDEKLAELEKRVSTHLAGRPVRVVWNRNPTSASAVGQVTKSMTNEMIVYIAQLNDLRSRYAVWLHELSHIYNGDFIARSNEHLRAPGSRKGTPESRAAWRQSPQELAAQRQAAAWEAYSVKYAYKYFRWGMTQMEAKLLCLLEWPKMDASQARLNKYKGAIK